MKKIIDMIKTSRDYLLIVMSGGIVWYAIYRGGKYEIRYREIGFQADIPTNR